VVAISLLPSLFIAAITGYQLAVAVLRTSRLEAARLVDGIAAQQRLILQGAEQMLRTIAASNAVQTGDVARMQAFFTRLVRTNHQYATILATDPTGLVVASGIHIDPYALNDRAYLAEALRRKSYVIGSYTISRATGLPVIPLALPVLGEEGGVRFVLIASLRVDVLMNAIPVRLTNMGPFWRWSTNTATGCTAFPPTRPSRPGNARPGTALLAESGSPGFPVLTAYRGRPVFARSSIITLTPSGETSFRLLLAIPASVNTGNTPTILIPYVSVGIISIGLSIALPLALHALHRQASRRHRRSRRGNRRRARRFHQAPAGR
jgi:hypothetical protein